MYRLCIAAGASAPVCGRVQWAMEKMYTVRCMAGNCVHEKVPSPKTAATQVAPPPTLGGPGIHISAPVGNASPNRADDVRTIQDALNRISRADGGPRVPLKVDGICGPRTKDCIQVFQVKQFGWKYADMKVEPGKMTIARLNELAAGGGGIAAGPPVPEVEVTIVDEAAEEAFKKLMTEHLERARRCIRACQFDITRALPVVDQPDNMIGAFSRKRLLARLNRHFDIDHARNRRDCLERMLSVFDNMEKVFQRPGGMWGDKAFLLYDGPLNRDRVGFTYRGGYYHAGEIGRDRLRYDTIYLTQSSAVLIAGKTHSGAGTILHELAHFVSGPQNFPAITDHAYGNIDAPKMKTLTPEKKMSNADSYANYAIEVGTGSGAYYLWT